MELIDKDKVVAEIENKLQDIIACKENALSTEKRVVLWAKIDMCNEILYYLDTLEVKEVNLDFEQELYKAFGQVKDFTLGMRIAKHFYVLGLNAKKGE